MGAAISFCATEALCCAGSMCCSLLCIPCRMGGVKAKNFAKIGYTFFQMVFLSIALILMFNSDGLQSLASKFTWIRGDDIVTMQDCPDEFNLSAEVCLGTTLMLRMSFSLALFHLLIFVLILARNDIVATIHDGCWGIKFFLVSIIFIVSFWISNDFFMNTYLVISKWVSIIFLIYQALLMLIVSYKINDTLVSNAEEDNCSSVILIVVTLLFTSFNGWWIVRQYLDFKCGYSVTTMTVTLIGIILMYGLVLVRSRADASILTSSIASCYCLYLQWAALSSDDNSSCNSNYNSSGNAIWQIVGGLFVTMVSLFIISGSTSTGTESATQDAGAHILEQEEDLEDKVEETDQQKAAGKTGHVFAISSATITFQLLLILTSVYYAMLCTNWGNLNVYNDGSDAPPNIIGSDISFWLKLVAEWITISLYVFSLIAPLIFSDRDYR